MTVKPAKNAYELLERVCKHIVASPEYVKEGIAGLRRFMKQHEAHLKARTLDGI